MGGVRPQSETLRAGLIPHRWTRVDDPQSVAIVDAYETIIGGGGPAGLTAAYELSKHGHSCVVLEADPRMVGGISRTDQYKGYRFDIGGHRFFSKSEEVNRLWVEILGEEFLTRDRLSRIYYDHKFFYYPLKPVDALWKLGFFRSCRILASYVKARLVPIKPECSFEDWVVNRFGRELFEIFFKSYTEKVWGMPTNTISADWAAQRIKDLSLIRAATSAVFGNLLLEAGRGDQDLDRAIPVSEARPGADVGGRPGSDSRAGRVGAARSSRGPDRARRILGDRIPDPGRGRSRDPLPRPSLPLDPAGPRADPGHEPAGPSRGPRGRGVAQVPRFPHRRPDRRPGRDLPR